MKLAYILIVGILYNAGYSLATPEPLPAGNSGDVSEIANSASQSNSMSSGAFSSAQSVYEWCGLAAERLQSYLRFLEESSHGNAKMQHRLSIQVLEEGLSKLTAAQQKLHESALNFHDDDEKEAVETKTKLRDQIRALGGLKAQVQVTLDTIKDIEDIDELDDVIKSEIRKPVEQLIEECHKYREQYVEQKNANA